MDESEKLDMVMAMSGESNSAVASAYLSLAGQKILRIAYPYDDTKTEVPDRYGHIQVEAAVYMLNKRGGEGEQSHSENGISRVYESADLPDSMIRSIVPQCGVIS